MNIYCCLTRQRELLKILIIKNHWVSSQELTSALNTTNNILEMDVGILNYVLEHYNSFIIFKRSSGYKLESRNIALLNSILFFSAKDDNILLRLLASNYSLNLSTLERDCCISKADLNLNLKYIKEMLNNFNPSLELITSYNCISIMGQEFAIRYLLTELLMANFNLESMYFSNGYSLINRQLFDSTLEKTIHLFNEENISLTPEIIATLVTYLEIVRLRATNNNTISFLEIKPQSSSCYYYSLAERLFESILPLRLYHKEKCFELSRLALLISIIDLLQSSGAPDLRPSDIDFTYVQPIVDSLLDALKPDLRIDLLSNEELYESFTMHIKVFINKMKHQQITPNITLEAIKIYYPFVHRLSTNIYEVFYNILNIKLSDSELIYAAVHLANTLEKLELD